MRVQTSKIFLSTRDTGLVLYSQVLHSQFGQLVLFYPFCFSSLFLYVNIATIIAPDYQTKFWSFLIRDTSFEQFFLCFEINIQCHWDSNIEKNKQVLRLTFVLCLNSESILTKKGNLRNIFFNMMSFSFFCADFSRRVCLNCWQYSFHRFLLIEINIHRVLRTRLSVAERGTVVECREHGYLREWKHN